jgi:hypothetical protein
LSIGEEKTQYRIDYLDKGTNRLSTKSNEKITEEITNDWWIPYEFIQVENNSLQEAISQLRDENDAMSEMYLNSEDPSLRKELRESSNENSTAINDFSADLFFEPQKFMNQYFNRATEKFSYDNSELSNEEFAKIIESDEFKNETITEDIEFNCDSYMSWDIIGWEIVTVCKMEKIEITE